MHSAGIETLSGTPEQFAALIKLKIARWTPVVKEANLSVE
jgi:tripartite-type tricarboxylate transporter receptor subunit TctC